MKTFKEFRYDLQEIDNNALGFGTGVNVVSNIAKFAGNKIVKPAVVNTLRRGYGMYKGIKKFIDKRPNTVKMEIGQDAKDMQK